MTEKFTTKSGKRYKILEIRQGQYNNTTIHGVYCNAESEKGDLIGLQVLFPYEMKKWLAINKDGTNPLREDVVEEIKQKFIAKLFYDELTADITIQLTFNARKNMDEKMVFDEFEIIKSVPFKLRRIGYPNFLADMHTKAENEILRVLYKNYGQTVDYIQLQKDIWFNDVVFKRAHEDLKVPDYIDCPTLNTTTLTIKGKKYYEEHVMEKS